MAASWAVPIVPTDRGREERGRERFCLQQRCRGVLRGARVRRGRAHAGPERLRTKSSQLVTPSASNEQMKENAKREHGTAETGVMGIGSWFKKFRKREDDDAIHRAEERGFETRG